MAETDLIWMSVLVFLPSAFALGLMFFPKGQEEYMRWWSLLGTAATLMVSILLFINFQKMIDFHGTSDVKGSLLAARAEKDAGRHDASQPPLADDQVSRYPWIPQFNIEYFMGLDGISMALVLLTTALTFLSMWASWKIDKFVRGYCMLFLLLETGMLGTFLSLDFFLFYIFWEVMLLPMYFLIGIWGGPRREYAAIKFFIYTLAGSVLILIAMLGFYFTNVRDFVSQDRVKLAKEELHRKNPGLDEKELEEQVVVNTFDLMVLQKAGKAAWQVLKSEKVDSEGLRQAGNDAAKIKAVKDRLQQPFFTAGFQYTMFVLLFIGFAIKVPVFPFHTWLPDAHVEAPTPISMILAGVLLKMGGYGIIRIAYPICPWAAEELAWTVGLFGIINIVYGAFAAMAQTDFKKLVAYSSVSHMGYVILGIAVWASPERSQYWSWGMNGAMFQMIAHGITSAGMFFLVGVIYDRAHHRNLDNFRGLNEPMPLYGGMSAIVFFGAMGLPGMCGFVGEFMVVLSTWNFSKPFAILSALTVIITAAYILWTLQRVFLGTNAAYKDYPDMSLREAVIGACLLVPAVVLGVAPNLLMSWMEPSVTGLVEALARLGP